jgi:hypothetical protein
MRIPLSLANIKGSTSKRLQVGPNPSMIVVFLAKGIENDSLCGRANFRNLILVSELSWQRLGKTQVHREPDFLDPATVKNSRSAGKCFRVVNSPLQAFF